MVLGIQDSLVGNGNWVWVAISDMGILFVFYLIVCESVVEMK